MTQAIDYQQENNIAVLRINRPEARNALNWAAQEAFAAAVTTVAQEPAVRALIITGAGDQAFVAGGDLKELSQQPDRAAGERLNRVMTAALAQLTDLPIPVIAAINGDAFGGGCEIVTSCDLRLAVAHARFSFAQVRVGLTTGWGGTGRLVRLVGQSQALDLLLTARLFSAEEAYRLGLVQRIVPPQTDVLTAARQMAVKLAALPRHALAATKRLVQAAGHRLPNEVAQLETDLFLSLWGQPDHREALAAFMEKRKPQFNEEM